MKIFKLHYLVSIIIVITIVVSGCKKDDNNSTPTVTDIDGNVYHTVTIGTQVWMVENLKVTHFRNGKSIPMVSDTTAWVDLASSGYCDYLNNPVNSDTYGRLYNWYAVSDTSKLCPVGWHVPSNIEWGVLEAYLGGSSIAGGKLKEAGTSHWESPNIDATNQSGFTGLPGGFRSSDGIFGYIQEYGYWWAADQVNSVSAWFWGLNTEDPYSYKYAYYKSYGLSVRCLKD